MSTTPIEVRINALIAKAESTDSDHEAKALLAKVQQLMMKHSIDEHALAAARGESPEAINQIGRKYIYFPHAIRHWKSLGVYGASYLGEQFPQIKIALSPKTRHVVAFGTSADIDAFELLLTAFWRQAENGLRRWTKSFEGKTFLAATPGQNSGEWYKLIGSYFIGFSQGVVEVMEAQNGRLAASDELVLADIKDRVNKAYEDSTRPGKARRAPQVSGYVMGQGASDGRQATLSQEVTQ